MRGAARAGALAAAAAAVLCAWPGGVLAKMQWGGAKVEALNNEVTSFMVIGEWGGSAASPYTTAGQLAAAAGLAKIAVEQAATFILSPGGNFYGGLQGALESEDVVTRVADTWNDVYNTPYSALAALPWYTIAGAADWAGNITAEILLNGTNSGQWLYPDLFYTFQTVVPFSGDTIEFIMIDTESLTGGINPVPAVLPDLYYPPPAPSPEAAEAVGAATAVGATASDTVKPAYAAASVVATTKTVPVSAAVTATVEAPTVVAAGPAAAATYAAGSARRLAGIANMAVVEGISDQLIDGYGKPTVNLAVGLGGECY